MKSAKSQTRYRVIGVHPDGTTADVLMVDDLDTANRAREALSETIIYERIRVEHDRTSAVSANGNSFAKRPSPRRAE